MSNNKNSRLNLKDLLSIIGGMIGVVVALGTLIKNLFNPQEFPYIAIAIYIIAFIITIWFVFMKAKDKETWRFTVLTLFYIFTAIFFVGVGTRINMPLLSTKPDIENVALPLYAQIGTSAWDALGKGEYTLAISITDVCIVSFETEAIQIQQALVTTGKASPPIGVVDDNEKAEINSHTVLNEVAGCYFIKAEALKNLGKIGEAKGVYKNIQQFPYARIWDPSERIFWSPVQRATEILTELQ